MVSAIRSIDRDDRPRRRFMNRMIEEDGRPALLAI
jgi:hypothetical protein